MFIEELIKVHIHILEDQYKLAWCHNELGGTFSAKMGLEASIKNPKKMSMVVETSMLCSSSIKIMYYDVVFST